MSIDKTRLINAYVKAHLNLPIIPSSGSSSPTYLKSMTDEQMDVVRQYFEIIVNELIEEITKQAKVTVSMSTHTHTFGPITVVGGGGGTVQGTTDTGGDTKEIGTPDDNSGGIE